MSIIQSTASPLLNNPAVNPSLKRTLYVGGLEDGVTKDILYTAFIPFGDIKTVEIPIERATGKHRGFGFVEFDDEEDANHAIDNMHDNELLGRTLTVNLARSGSKQAKDMYKPVWEDISTVLNESLDVEV